MEDLNITAQEIEKMVAATFDSVNLINKLDLLESLNEDQFNIRAANLSHLELMMAHKWFVEALTETQKATINKLIIS